MKVALRILGGLLLLAALAALGRELYGYVGEGDWTFMPLGELWAWIDRGSLLLLEPAVVRHLSEGLWYGLVEPILLTPAWIVLAVPALVLLALSFAFRRRRGRRLFARG